MMDELHSLSQILNIFKNEFVYIAACFLSPWKRLFNIYERCFKMLANSNNVKEPSCFIPYLVLLRLVPMQHASAT